MKKTEHPTSNIQHPTPNKNRCALSQHSNGSWFLHEGQSGRGKYDLEERLLEFASAVIDLTERLPASRAGNHVAGQLLRSGTSPFPNHGEAEDAESREDFIHKLKICLKEMRETRPWARLIQRMSWAKDDPALLFLLRESDELIRIFFSSIQTAQRNALSRKRTQSGPGERLAG